MTMTFINISVHNFNICAIDLFQCIVISTGINLNSRSGGGDGGGGGIPPNLVEQHLELNFTQSSEKILHPY